MYVMYIWKVTAYVIEIMIKCQLLVRKGRNLHVSILLRGNACDRGNRGVLYYAI